ncbi:uncharacterized protein LOC143043088 [Mytilus galloprovincialis]|uniref:uncharacterized protein LOC143043088 n=1 Tax=Mytilus galloprovincialis TaxID=29158 RepID=UPI003F7C61C9
MFSSERKPERMVKYKLNLLIIVVFLNISQYKGLIIREQNPIDQQTDIFFIDDSGTRETSFVDGSGLGTGSDFGLLPNPLLALALLMIPMIMMPMMSSVTSESSSAVAPIPVVSTPVLVTVPSTQAAVQTTTPCVPTNCPAEYRLLNDQTASPNCYRYSGVGKLSWSESLKECTKTPGAYLWKPNDEKEADAVRSVFAFGTDVDVWIGAHSPLHDGNYEYAVVGGALSLTNLPFGTLFTDTSKEDCIEIEVNNSNVWEWDDEGCDDKIRYICEVPRQTCP